MLMILKKIPKKSDICFVNEEKVWTGKYDSNNYKIYETKITKNCREGIELAKSTKSSGTKEFDIQFLIDKPYKSVPDTLNRKIKVTADLENGTKRVFTVPFSIKKFTVDKNMITFAPVLSIPFKAVTVIKKSKNSALIMKEVNTNGIKNVTLTVENK